MKMRTRNFLPRKLTILALALTGVALILTRWEIPNVWARTNRERKPILVRKPIDEGRRIRLRGNTRPEANKGMIAAVCQTASRWSTCFFS